MSQTRDLEAADFYSWTSHVASVFTHHQELAKYVVQAVGTARTEHNMRIY